MIGQVFIDVIFAMYLSFNVKSSYQMDFFRMNAPDIDSAAHVVQLALTPIFLLSGIASLLSVFTNRLGRIADQVDMLSIDPSKRPLQLRRLKLRSKALDFAVLMASLAGGLTCCAALALFLGAIRNDTAGSVLFILFGGALICAIGAMTAFSYEMVLAGRTVREKVDEDTANIPGKTEPTIVRSV